MTGEARLRVLVADDEPVARELLADLLRAEPDLDLVATCADGAEARERIAAGGVDVAFLDIQMPGLDGFEVLDALALEARPAIVFVTAHDEHALRAFDVQAWDYLLKPFDGERLARTLDQVRGRLTGDSGGMTARDMEAVVRRLTQADERPRRLAVRSGTARVTVEIDDIEWVGAESNYVRLHLVDGRSHLARISLTRLTERLDPRRFVRIHRSAVVNVQRVARLEPCGHGDVALTLTGGRRLTLSRRYREAFDSRVEALS